MLFFLDFARDENINVNICSALQTQTEQLANLYSNSNCNATVLDVSSNSNQLDELIGGSDLVVSLLPYNLHPMIARKCIEYKKNMLTASYASEEMCELDEQAKEAGITILNEIGLDPGIDHLLAMECFDQVRKQNGRITSFISFCGGLPAPENADNSLGYKFSWNPRGVLLATMNPAKYLKNNEIVQVKEGERLFVQFVFCLSIEPCSCSSINKMINCKNVVVFFFFYFSTNKVP